MFHTSRYLTPYKICRHYAKGWCNLNNRCNFLHVDAATLFDATGSADHNTTDTAITVNTADTSDTADTADTADTSNTAFTAITADTYDTAITADTTYVYTVDASSVYADTLYSDEVNDVGTADDLNDATTRKQKVQSCWHFLSKGACLRGNECNFVHELPNPDNIIKSQYPCRHFLRGNCKQGKHCTFVHDPTKIVACKSSHLCKHFANGWCERGDRCNFMHNSLYTHISYENQCVGAPASVQTSAYTHSYVHANTGLQFGVPVQVVFLPHMAQVITFG